MKEKLLEILNSINPNQDYETNDKLFDDGILDSLAMVSIVGGIEEELGIEIDAEDIVGENFNSLDTMLKLLEKYKK